MRNEFYKDSQGAILVYDVNHRSSFDSLGEWLVEMRSHLPRPSDIDDIIIAVCANKVKGFLIFTCSKKITKKIPALMTHVMCLADV